MIYRSLDITLTFSIESYPFYITKSRYKEPYVELTKLMCFNKERNFLLDLFIQLFGYARVFTY